MLLGHNSTGDSISDTNKELQCTETPVRPRYYKKVCFYGQNYTKATRILLMGHSIPNQQKKIPTLLDFHEIWYRHGPYKETFSHQNLADSIDFPLRYDHLNFIITLAYSVHMFNKMAITLSVIVIELFHLDFWNAH